MNKFLIVLVPFVLAVALADDDGQYRPDVYGGDNGQYRPGDEGKYAGQSGAYKSQGVGSGSQSSYKAGGQSSYKSGGQAGRLSASAASNYNSQFVNRFIVDSAASNVSPFKSAQQNAYKKPVAVQVAAPAAYKGISSNEGQSRIIKQDSEADPNSYRYNFETENNIVVQENGNLINAGSKDEGIKATGFYEYIGPDNIKYRVDYIADENGFRAVGDHLPTPPSV